LNNIVNANRSGRGGTTSCGRCWDTTARLTLKIWLRSEFSRNKEAPLTRRTSFRRDRNRYRDRDRDRNPVFSNLRLILKAVSEAGQHCDQFQQQLDSGCDLLRRSYVVLEQLNQSGAFRSRSQGHAVEASLLCRAEFSGTFAQSEDNRKCCALELLLLFCVSLGRLATISRARR
jgi:hypothetical protein